MRLRVAPVALLISTLLLGATGSAQATGSMPDVIIQIHRAPAGADMVDVSVRSSSYPKELLADQLTELGRRLTGARAIQAYRSPVANDASMTVVKGSCGVDGLIDRLTGGLNFLPILQAFAGAPAPYTLKHLLISFDGERPGAKTVRSFTSKDFSVSGRVIGSSVEYDVELRTQDPSKLVIDNGTAAVPARKSSGVDPINIVLLVVAGVAAGALVYSLFLMLGRRPAGRR